IASARVVVIRGFPAIGVYLPQGGPPNAPRRVQGGAERRRGRIAVRAIDSSAERRARVGPDRWPVRHGTASGDHPAPRAYPVFAPVLDARGHIGTTVQPVP